MLKLHEVAETLYQEKGPRLSVSDIARVAGVSRPTVYQQLGTKAEILARLTATPGVQENPQDVEGRLMTAVRQVANRHGFKAMTLEQVAEDAGIGITTIYRRYSNKETLIQAFVKTHAPNRFLTEEVADARNGLDGLTNIVTVLLTFMHNNRDLVRLVLSGAEEDRKYLRGLRESSSSTFDRLCTFFEAQSHAVRIDPSHDAEKLSQNLFGMIYAHTVLAADQTGFDLDQSRDAILAMFAPLFKDGS